MSPRDPCTIGVVLVIASTLTALIGGSKSTAAESVVVYIDGATGIGETSETVSANSLCVHVFNICVLSVCVCVCVVCCVCAPAFPTL